MTFVNFWLDLAVRPPFLPLLGRRGGRGLRRIIFCCVALTAAAADDDASNVASDASRVASCFLLSDDTVSGGLRVRCCWRLCVGADALPPLVDWDDCEALPVWVRNRGAFWDHVGCCDGIGRITSRAFARVGRHFLCKFILSVPIAALHRYASSAGKLHT